MNKTKNKSSLIFFICFAIVMAFCCGYFIYCNDLPFTLLCGVASIFYIILAIGGRK